MTLVLLVPRTGDTAVELGRVVDRLSALPARTPVRVETVGPDDLTAARLPTAIAAALDAAPDGLTIVASGLDASDEALLRIVDDPSLTLAALVGAPDPARHPSPSGATMHPVATAGAALLTAGTAVHPVADADGQFLGALRIGPSVARAAARVLRYVPRIAEVDPVDLVLTALSRSAALPPVAVVRPDPFPAVRGPAPSTAVAERPVPADLAARTAARPGDGFYSTYVLRRLSARITPLAVRRRVRPNTVTAVSTLIGLLGAGGFALGSWATLAIGAVLLQISLVLDCVDGEIARATRQRSPFGGWLDGATDRVKEYAAIAGLAAAGHHLWPLAAAGMVVQTVRHLQDFAFDKGVLATWRSELRDVRPLSDVTPWQRPAGVGRGPEPLTGSAGMWLRRVVRMPIAERWLVLGIAAVCDAPAAGLIAYLVLAITAELYTVAGAVRRTRGPLGRYPAELATRLADYRDDGVLGLATAARAPHGPLGWLLPPLTAVVEGAVVLGVTVGCAPHWAGAAFGWFAVVAWHRYDVVYRRGGATPVVPERVGLLGLGWAVRCAVLVIGAALGVLPGVLVAGICWLALVYLPESLAAGARTLKAS